MEDLIYIVISTIIVMGIGCPFVTAFSKWKKVMDDAQAEIDGESGDK